MNWNNKGYVIQQPTLYKSAKVMEQHNTFNLQHENIVSFYAWEDEKELFSNSMYFTVAIWRKKETK